MFAGCSPATVEPVSSAAPEPLVSLESDSALSVKRQVPLVEEKSTDHLWQWQRLGDRVPECTIGDWQVSTAPGGYLGWSTMTLSLPDGLTPTSQRESVKAWAEPTVALTISTRDAVSELIADAISETREPGGYATKESVAAGWQIAVSASNSDDPDACFVRVSFSAAK